MSKILELLESETPKIKLNSEIENKYIMGLKILDFIFNKYSIAYDLPTISDGVLNDFSTEAAYIELPYLHANQIFSINNKFDLLVVWEISNNSRSCPLRISIDLDTENNSFTVYMHLQALQGYEKIMLLGKKGDDYYNENIKLDNIKISNLLSFESQITLLAGE